jgi:hypothetical protein
MTNPRLGVFHRAIPEIGDRYALQRRCSCGRHTGTGMCPQGHGPGLGPRAKSPGISHPLVSKAGDRVEGQIERIMRETRPSRENRRWLRSPERADTAKHRPDLPEEVRAVVEEPGDPVSSTQQTLLQSRLGVDLKSVRVHSSYAAVKTAADLGVRAFTVGADIVVAPGAPTEVVAHEVAHTATSTVDGPPIRAYGTPIPVVTAPSVVTMAEFIGLVKRIEAANPGKRALEIARLIMRTKYNAKAWDYLLPSSAGTSGVSAGGGVTSADVTTLTGEFEVTLPQSGPSDPSHIVTALVADAETQAPGAGGSAGLSGRLVQDLPKGVTQRDVATWVGDVASAAAEWATAHPHPKGGTTKQTYLDEYAPESDLIADIDGIAMTSRAAGASFVFDPTAPLSSNLQRFYYPSAPREGKNRRFHAFCSQDGLALKPDGISLSARAVNSIEARVRLNADWFEKNDPNLLSWVSLNAGGLFNPIRDAWIDRANDWKWFADKFRSFVETNLKAEGP